ncbi:MAG: hypothetical protein JO319_06560 [Acidobacteriaceae bacterium]|nr:hypothetical protein [Acidobacteriaceae bacterium]
MAGHKDQQGTGKHPHKSTEEPYPHHEASSGKGKEDKDAKHESGRAHGAAAGAGSHSGGEHRGKGGQSESSDLKEREYKDAEGNVHHHTRTAEAMHGKDKK